MNDSIPARKMKGFEDIEMQEKTILSSYLSADGNFEVTLATKATLFHTGNMTANIEFFTRDYNRTVALSYPCCSPKIKNPSALDKENLSA